jgi:DNA-directed RNA polymerase specialized sigma24 family protein
MRHLSAPGCSVAPRLAEPSDEELLSRLIATGGEAAFGALLDRYERMLRSICWHVLQQQQDAEDAFQQILIVMMQKAKSIRKGESLKSWLHSVAYRTAR